MDKFFIGTEDLDRDHRIESLGVEGLFGHLSYIIEIPSSDVAILYGENGTGKTTLLSLLYRTLSPEDSRGHRTEIALVPFRRFFIKFSAGHQVEVTRKESVAGPFTMVVAIEGEEIVRHNFVLEEGAVRSQEGSTYPSILKALKKIGLGLFFLPDDRNIDSNLWDDDHRTRNRRGLMQMEMFDSKSESSAIDTLVNDAMSRSISWCRRSALSATNRGDNDASKIYFEIVTRLINRSEGGEIKGGIDSVMTGLRELKSRSDQYTELGLTSEFDVDNILGVLKKAKGDQRTSVVEVLAPYLQTFNARLDALEAVKEAMETFARIFNEFYAHKSISFDLNRGFKISQKYNGEDLNPNCLSSGEKQLLLLFCNVLVARTRPSLFIIDEPELSLNIKWQRKLIRELRNCVQGSEVQFVMATHSLEMINTSRDSAIRLNA